MNATKAAADKMGIIPKLVLGNKLARGGVKPTGAHTLTFVSDSLTKKFDEDLGQEVQGIEYIVEEKGQMFRWFVPLYAKDESRKAIKKDGAGKPVPHYLIEKLMTIKEGQKAVVEMMKFGAKNYIDVQLLA